MEMGWGAGIMDTEKGSGYNGWIGQLNAMRAEERESLHEMARTKKMKSWIL
jgi:hypothetical protein